MDTLPSMSTDVISPDGLPPITRLLQLAAEGDRAALDKSTPRSTRT